jgi:hypothetical protein
MNSWSVMYCQSSPVLSIQVFWDGHFVAELGFLIVPLKWQEMVTQGPGTRCDIPEDLNPQ